MMQAISVTSSEPINILAKGTWDVGNMNLKFIFHVFLRKIMILFCRYQLIILQSPVPPSSQMSCLMAVNVYESVCPPQYLGSVLNPLGLQYAREIYIPTLCTLRKSK